MIKLINTKVMRIFNDLKILIKMIISKFVKFSNESILSIIHNVKLNLWINSWKIVRSWNLINEIISQIQ